jgi:hypothetical protein
MMAQSFRVRYAPQSLAGVREQLRAATIYRAKREAEDPALLSKPDSFHRWLCALISKLNRERVRLEREAKGAAA